MRSCENCGRSCFPKIKKDEHDSRNGVVEITKYLPKWLNGERHRNIVTDYLWPQLSKIDVSNALFQEDGATCHAAREFITLLQEYIIT